MHWAGGAVIEGYGVSSILVLGQNNQSIMKNIEQGIGGRR